MVEIPKELLKKIKEEMVEDFNEGFSKSIEFAKEHRFSTISKILGTEREAAENRLRSEFVIDGSNVFFDGFFQGLKKIVEEAEKSEE